MSRNITRSSYGGGGKGIGDRLSEWAVYIIVIGAVAYGINWYVKVFLPSPTNILSTYIKAVNDGSSERQYPMLSSSTKRFFPSAKAYEKNWPSAVGLAAKIGDFHIDNVVVNGDKADADATLVIRRSGQELYQASTDKFQDHYVLVHEQDGWKIALDQCQDKLESAKAARTFR